MFNSEDNTYNEIRQKSVEQWLEDMLGHEDVMVRGGVNATKGYIQSLRAQIDMLENKNKVKAEYLKKIKNK